MKGDRLRELRESISRDPKRRGSVDANKRRMYDQIALNRLRRELSMTQQQVAELLGVTQESVSQLERRNEIMLSTLCKYVQALGGTVEMFAVFGDRVIPLPVAADTNERRDSAVD